MYPETINISNWFIKIIVQSDSLINQNHPRGIINKKRFIANYISELKQIENRPLFKESFIEVLSFPNSTIHQNAFSDLIKELKEKPNTLIIENFINKHINLNISKYINDQKLFIESELNTKSRRKTKKEMIIATIEDCTNLKLISEEENFSALESFIVWCENKLKALETLDTKERQPIT